MALLTSVFLAVLAVKAQAALDIIPGGSWTAVGIYAYALNHIDI